MQSSTPLSPIKPIRYLHSYVIKEDFHGNRLQKLRLQPKNLELHKYLHRKSKWIKTRIPVRYKTTCFSHLKGLTGFSIPLGYYKAFHLLQSQKHVFMNIRKFSFYLGYYTSPRNLQVLEESLGRMKHLTQIRDCDKEMILKKHCFVNVKCFRQVKNLDLPSHVMIKYLNGVRQATIYVEKLESIGRIAKLPESLRILNVVDQNPTDQRNHVEALKMITKQINSLKNLEVLNMIFPKKSYFYHDLFPVLEGKEIEVRIIARIDYEDQVLEEMKIFTNRTNSLIKIIPSGFSNAEKYIKQLNFLLDLKNERITLERLIYPFNSEEELQKEVLEYYKRMTHMTKQVEFLLEFHSLRGWFESQNLCNYQEMLEIIQENADRDVEIIHHLVYLEQKDQKRKIKNEIRDIAVGLLLNEKVRESKRKKTIKVTSSEIGFEIIKTFISKLFGESPSFQVERIDWVNSCLNIPGLREVLNDLKHKQNIKDYSVVKYQQFESF